MAGSFKFKEMRTVLNNMNREIRKIKGRTHRGLIEGAIIIWRDADEMVPVDTSNLRHSFFIVSHESSQNQAQGTGMETFKGRDAGQLAAEHESKKSAFASMARTQGGDSQPVVIFGHSANYAAFVHENTDADFTARGRQKARSHWLQISMDRNESKVIQVVQQHARIR